MSWYNEAIFYHIYPLGLTGAPKENDYGTPVSRLNTLIPWISHIKEIGCTALYIGPLFESVGHGYETTDYKKLDSRLGTNEDLKDFVEVCHENQIKVIFDGVFNHTGRDFFAFKDIQQNREHSRYLNWYCNVNFGGNNEYNDGFSYIRKFRIISAMSFDSGYLNLMWMESVWMQQMCLILISCTLCAVPQKK